MPTTPKSGIDHFELNGNPEVPINDAFDDLDENSSGYLSVAVDDSNQNLVTTVDADGDPVWLRARTIEFIDGTGAPTANRTITISAAEQAKRVFNNTTAQALIFDAGGATYTLPFGKAAVIFVDSSNDVVAIVESLEVYEDASRRGGRVNKLVFDGTDFNVASSDGGETQTITSTGAGSGGSGGGSGLIDDLGTFSATGGASIDCTEGANDWTLYHTIEFIVRAQPDTDADDLWMRVDVGAGFISTGTPYQYALGGETTSGSFANRSAAANQILLVNAVGTASGEQVNSEVKMHDPGKDHADGNQSFHIETENINSSGLHVMREGGGWWDGTTRVVGVQFLASSGNITGSVYVRGHRKAAA